MLRQNRKTDRIISESFAVRRVARQLAKKDAVVCLSNESAHANYARELGHEVVRAKMSSSIMIGLPMKAFIM